MTGKELLCKLYSADLSPKRSETADNICNMILSDIPDAVDITRKQAAIIIHEYLRKILKEADETDITRATKLKDLYDCRVCVKHIEQVYIKGIMDPMIDCNASLKNGLPILFGGNELLTDEEAKTIIERVWDKSKRQKRKSTDELIEKSEN